MTTMRATSRPFLPRGPLPDEAAGCSGSASFGICVLRTRWNSWSAQQAPLPATHGRRWAAAVGPRRLATHGPRASESDSEGRGFVLSRATANRTRRSGVASAGLGIQTIVRPRWRQLWAPGWARRWAEQPPPGGRLTVAYKIRGTKRSEGDVEGRQPPRHSVPPRPPSPHTRPPPPLKY